MTGLCRGNRLSLPALAFAFVIARLAFAAPGAQHAPMLITDFENADELGWQVVNDDVMGGRSDGDFRIAGGVLEFAGRTNTNGGGFASIRSRPALPSLAGVRAVHLRARGDGRRYVLRLEDDAGTAYWADFDPAADAWAWVEVPLEAFRPRYRGRWLSGPPLDPERIRAIGIMCYDGADGPFRLEVDRIEAR